VRGDDRRSLSFDNPEILARALADPVFFAREIDRPVLIDEVQYAPSVLESVKVAVDQAIYDEKSEPGIFWLTGSQGLEIMKRFRESLTGRVAIIHLHGLSDEEKGISYSPQDVFASIAETSFPALRGEIDSNARDLYLESYVQTYLVRDVATTAQLRRLKEFSQFIRMMAIRTGQEIDSVSLGRDTGVSNHTVDDWLTVLEGSFIIRKVRPWFPNRSRRLTKRPKYV